MCFFSVALYQEWYVEGQTSHIRRISKLTCFRIKSNVKWTVISGKKDTTIVYQVYYYETGICFSCQCNDYQTPLLGLLVKPFFYVYIYQILLAHNITSFI